MYNIIPVPHTESSKLHFCYRLADLQNEIEKRTSYLGKFRNTDTAAHLQDVIAMTKDETNLFSSLIEETSQEVFDSFRKGVLNIGESWHEIKENITPTKIELNPTVPYTSNLNVVANGNSIDVVLDFITTSGISSVYTFIPTIEVEYDTTCHLLIDHDIQITAQKKSTFTIPYENISCVEEPSRKLWQVRYSFLPALEGESQLTSAETISNIVKSKIVELKTYNKTETPLYSGDIVEIGGEIYEVTKNTNINDINIEKDLKKIDKLNINDGVHYYLHMPSYLQTNLIYTLDNAIKAALTYGVIWKWLMYAYPTEAETYAAFYSSANNDVYTKCNIFNRGYSKKPRIL